MNYHPTNIERERLEWALQRWFGVGVPFVIVDYCLPALHNDYIATLWSLPEECTSFAHPKSKAKSKANLTVVSLKKSTIRD